MRRLSVMFLDRESENGAQVLESRVGVGGEKDEGKDWGCEYKQKRK